MSFPGWMRSALVTQGLALLCTGTVSGEPAGTAQSIDQPTTDIESISLEELLGTVNAVSKKEESLLRAPATVTVLDEDDFRMSGATSIADVLRVVPGVQVFRSAAGNYTVSLRGTGGLQGNNVVVLVDGVPMNSRIDASVDWAGLPIVLSDVERIEIVRGPVSTIYGANAYTGVIHILTRRGRPGETGITARAIAGGDTALGPAGELALHANGRSGSVSWRTIVNATRDQAFSRSSQLDSDMEIPLTRAGALLGVTWSPSTSKSLELQAGASLGERSGLDHLVLSSTPLSTSQVYCLAKLSVSDLPSVLDRFESWARAGRLSMSTSSEATGFTYDGARSIDGEIGVDLHLELASGLTGTVGGNAGVANVTAPFLHPAESGRTRPNYGFYLSSELSRGSWVFTAAVRGDVSAMTEEPQFSYRGSAIFVTEASAFRLSVGSAYREPSYVEVGSRFRDPRSGHILLEGTPGLESPRINSVELGVLTALARSITIRPTIYLAHLGHLVVEDFEPLVRKTFATDSESRLLLGGELESEWQLGDHRSLLVNFAALRWLSEGRSEAATMGIPEHNSSFMAHASLRAEFPIYRLFVSMGASVQSARHYNVRAGIPPVLFETKLPFMTRLELAAERDLEPRWPLRLFVKLQAHVPHGRTESPFPVAPELSTALLVGADYRH